MDKTFILCSCESPEHQMIFHHDELLNEQFIYVNIHLAKRPFFERIIYGIKYIFGHRSRYGAFDEFLLGPQHVEDLGKIQKFLSKNGKEKSAWRESAPENPGMYLARGVDHHMQIAYFNGSEWCEPWGSKKLKIKEWSEIPK